MHPLFDPMSAAAHVADRRRRLERAARDHREIVAAITRALVDVRHRLRHGRDPAPVVVALPAAEPAPEGDDRAPTWASERVA